jgi:hypothetical protein
MADAKSLGQIAYEAFWAHEGWMDDRGQQVVSWACLAAPLQTSWAASARAVAVQVTKARQQVELEALESQE